MTNIQPIRTEANYAAALQQIELLMESADAGTLEEDRLDLLATLVAAYEATYHPIGPPDPIGALDHYLDRMGLERKDLVPYIGAIGRVHEIMNRRRPLTLAMIRRLSAATGIPIATLAQPYDRLPYESRLSAKQKRQPSGKRSLPVGA